MCVNTASMNRRDDDVFLYVLLALRIIIFCAKKTLEDGISMPKSPRATMIPDMFGMRCKSW